MNIAKILSLSTIAASLVFITGCTTVQTVTNTNEVDNTNTANANVVTNTNENTNAVVVNENTNTEQEGDAAVDTSDWLTYTNDEYGFSLQYPSDWSIGGNDSNHIGVIVEKLANLPLVEKIAPTSSSSPESQDQNEIEKSNLESNKASAFGGTLVKNINTNFFRYIGYIEGGSIDIEYVTYLDDSKVIIRYLEGDNSDFVDALNDLGRAALIKQYGDNAIDNQVLKQNFETLGKIIETFQK